MVNHVLNACLCRAILHDEKIFPEPETFQPTRHLTADGQLSEDNPSEAAFGLGRRICPGRHFATDTVWLAIAHLLAAFDIRKVVNADGRVMEPTGEYTPGLLM